MSGLAGAASVGGSGRHAGDPAPLPFAVTVGLRVYTAAMALASMILLVLFGAPVLLTIFVVTLCLTVGFQVTWVGVARGLRQQQRSPDC